MSNVDALGYAGLTVTDLAAWQAMLTNVLGLQVVEHDGGLRARADGRAYRLELHEGETDTIDQIGWEVRTRDAFHQLVERLESNGVAVEDSSDDLARSRDVREIAVVRDPDGNRIELFHGQRVADEAFVSPTGATFVTDGLGFGHGFQMVGDLAAARHWYVDLLGFKVSDTIPLGGGVDALFLRCNPRHHSMGIAAAPNVPPHTAHLMFETTDVDQVGRAYDLCRDGAAPITSTLGRHSNDRMLSFYVRNPSGFDIEYGTDGLLVDEATWSETVCNVESFWGHRRTPANARGPQPGSEF